MYKNGEIVGELCQSISIQDVEAKLLELV